mmetsp:Transcript_34465/g.112211  ORF Transcript_34465/g.112211 Transcript_34465/m.112211 type:complete len:277 (+) Transcript_34465:2678-3508(+)
MTCRLHSLHDLASSLHCGCPKLAVGKQVDELHNQRQHERCGSSKTFKTSHCSGLGGTGVLPLGVQSSIDLGHDRRVGLLVRLHGSRRALLFLAIRRVLFGLSFCQRRTLCILSGLDLDLFDFLLRLNVGRVLLEFLQGVFQFLLLDPVGLAGNGLLLIIDFHLMLQDELFLLLKGVELPSSGCRSRCRSSLGRSRCRSRCHGRCRSSLRCCRRRGRLRCCRRCGIRGCSGLGGCLAGHRSSGRWWRARLLWGGAPLLVPSRALAQKGVNGTRHCGF